MEKALRAVHKNLGPHLACLPFMVGSCSNKGWDANFVYKLINNNRTKYDSWLNSKLTMEKDVLEFDENHNFDPSQYHIAVSKIMRLK